jgi:hypothetical protein
MGDYFREFLALSLERQHADIADKVRGMTGGELHSLYDYIRSCQALGE